MLSLNLVKKYDELVKTKCYNQEFEEIEYAPSEKHDGCAWIKVVDGCWICDGKWEHQTSVVLL